MTIDMHAHLVPPSVLDDLDKEPSRYGVHLEEAAAGGRVTIVNREGQVADSISIGTVHGRSSLA